MNVLANKKSVGQCIREETSRRLDHSLYLYTVALCISVLDKTDVDRETLSKIIYETQELFDGILGEYVGFDDLIDELENDHKFKIDWKKRKGDLW